MTHHLAVSSTLSAGARDALTDFLTASVPVNELLDPDSGWPADASHSVARELVTAGYGTVENGTFRLDIRPLAPQQLPTDELDELVPALTAIDGVFADVLRRRTESTPNPSNELGVSFAVLAQLQNVLRLAVYSKQGRIPEASVIRQLPIVATMLARAIHEEVA